MESSKSKNKQILKNTLFMYSRMIVMLIISLFTARIVYNTLGIENYGTYSVVGGIIVFFAFLNNGLSSATKRYVTGEIAIGTEESISHVFNTCIIAHCIVALIVLVLAEVIGVYVVNEVLNIPSYKLYAANYVYQLSVISAVLGIIQSPFGAVILAYEKMNIYAYFTITDVIFKLLVIYLVQTITGDKLIVYALLIFGVSIIDMMMYRIYTFITFPVCRLKKIRIDKPLLKEVFSFTTYSLAGQAAVVGTNQGVSVLVNLYHSVAVNAAMGVSSTITNTVQGFVGNFQAAFNPQIIKSYASKDYAYLETLMVKAAKISSFLIIIFLVPLIFEIGNVLTLWLGDDYPKYTEEFCLLVLFSNYIEALAAPLWMMLYAQSNIKKYQLIVSSIYSLNFFGSWIVLFLGALPYHVITIRIFIFLILLMIRLYYVGVLFQGFHKLQWVKKVVIN
ncbi:lipopolysaccharide biosynthesis protein, partial [Bacteroides caecigallinarum]